MDILDIKREFSEYSEKIDGIRGSLWPWCQREKNKGAWEKDPGRGILEWQENKLGYNQRDEQWKRDNRYF